MAVKERRSGLAPASVQNLLEDESAAKVSKYQEAKTAEVEVDATLPAPAGKRPAGEEYAEDHERVLATAALEAGHIGPAGGFRVRAGAEGLDARVGQQTARVGEARPATIQSVVIGQRQRGEYSGP